MDSLTDMVKDIWSSSNFQLEQEEGLIRGDAELKSFITRYYKSLFGAPDSSYVSLDKTRTDELQLRK